MWSLGVKEYTGMGRSVDPGSILPFGNVCRKPSTQCRTGNVPAQGTPPCRPCSENRGETQGKRLQTGRHWSALQGNFGSSKMAAKVYVGGISPTLSEKDLEDEVRLIMECHPPAVRSPAAALTGLVSSVVYSLWDAAERMGSPQASR